MSAIKLQALVSKYLGSGAGQRVGGQLGWWEL